MGFTKNKADPNLYLKVVEDELVILLLYADNLLIRRISPLQSYTDLR